MGSYPAKSVSMPRTGPAPLEDDVDLIRAMKEEMKFVDDPDLQMPASRRWPGYVEKRSPTIARVLEFRHPEIVQGCVGSTKAINRTTWGRYRKGSCPYWVKCPIENWRRRPESGARP